MCILVFMKSLLLSPYLRLVDGSADKVLAQKHVGLSNISKKRVGMIAQICNSSSAEAYLSLFLRSTGQSS